MVFVGQCSLELIIDLLEKLELNHSLEILKLESGFVSVYWC